MEPVAVTPTLRLTADGVYEGGVGSIEAINAPWSPVGRLGV
jgi:hypothetical protein